MVEQVKEFRPEFEAHLLTNRELFYQRSVPGLVSRPADDIAACVAECSLDGVVLERTRVEQRTRHTRPRVWIADKVGTGTVEADRTATIRVRDRNDVGRGVVVSRSRGKHPR